VTLLTAPQVAEILNISERGVRRLASTGELPSVQIGGSRRFDPADVEAFIDAGRTRKLGGDVVEIKGWIASGPRS
jgi:excisionase family DNA binding protein